MEKMEKKEIIRLRGFAEANGVAYEAGFFTGTTTVGDIGKLVTVKEDGSLTCENYSFEENVPKMSQKIYKVSKIVKITTIILAIVCLVGYLMTSIATSQENYLGFSMAYIFFGLSFMSKAVTVGLGRFLGNRDMENFSKYLGAKNSVVNSYYYYGRVPSVEEAKEITRTLERGDFVEDATFASFMILLGICRVLPTWGFLIAAIVVLVFCHRLDFHWFWQMFFLTSKPDEIHYQAAIKALKEALKWTENFSVKVSEKELTVEEFKKAMGHVFEEKKCSKCGSYKFCKMMWDQINSGKGKISYHQVDLIEEEKKE